MKLGSNNPTPKEVVTDVPENTDSKEIETYTPVKDTQKKIIEERDALVIESASEIKPPNGFKEIAATRKIDITKPVSRVSALSISSLKTKKEHELNKKDVDLEEGQLPDAIFTEEQMQHHWAEFVQKIDDEGRKILASNLHSDIPKLNGKHTICIQLPNDTMKKEIEREQYDLMEYLKSKLNNHFIELRIVVNEEAAKKFAFTPEEKYEKLREKNPVLDLLRKEFDLDL